MPPRHPYIISLIIFFGKDIMLLLRLSQGISLGRHHATPTPIFFNCHYFGKWALCFCFDIANVFLQSPTEQPLHHFLIVIILGSGRYASASTLPRYFFRMPPRHPYTIFRKCHYCGKGHYVSASTKPRYFFSVTPCNAYTQFLRNCHYCGKGHYVSAST